MSHPVKPAPSKAVLVGLQLPQVSSDELESSLVELSRLVTTLGYQVIGRVTQKRSSARSANVLGEGKLKELALWTGGKGEVGSGVERKKHKAALRREQAEAEIEDHANLEGDDVDDVILDDEMGDQFDTQNQTDAGSAPVLTPPDQAQFVIVDSDLSPSQMRNLESATGATVLDRTGVIIEIFSRHARTRAARLQVEIARLTYLAPRLRETGGGGDRQSGGIGGKGAGETTLELDRRKIRDRIKELRIELNSVADEHLLRRARREQELTVALVGYTNAGKSSLMRALTGSEVLVADKLFATLDTTVRPLYPESRPKVLVSDTVGFIKKLPHDLVASFKSTLDEALGASLLLFVVDSSDPAFRSQLDVTRKVLDEVGANDVPSLLVLNKRDSLTSEATEMLTREFPEAVMISTRNTDDVKRLRERILTYFEKDMIDADLFVPYTVQGAIGEIRARTRVLNESYTETGVTLRVRGEPKIIENIKKRMVSGDD